MLRSRQKGINNHRRQDEQATHMLPPSALFSPGEPVIGSQAATLIGEPTNRMVWRIVLTAVAATLVLIAVVLGGYAFYHHTTTEISDLKKERQHLQATNAGLSDRLASTRTKLRKREVSLAKSAKGLTLAKKNLTNLSKDLAAETERATANYNAGFSDGTSSGYSSGRDAGLVAGSDELACSDDVDVTWLPACNY